VERTVKPVVAPLFVLGVVALTPSAQAEQKFQSRCLWLLKHYEKN